MYTNSAYLNNSLLDFVDKSQPLVIGSCGTYHLFTKERLPTYRPKGRLDYQLLYIASGQAHFYFEKDKETIVTAGHMVIYCPKEMQKYVYYNTDQTEVYWVHFTGSDVRKILQKYNILEQKHVIYSGTSLEYTRLFKQMIYELQLCQAGYKELLSMLLETIFILLHRQSLKDKIPKNRYLESEMELATQYFNENYNTDISIEDYASSRGMSISWFIRSYKHYTNITPMQYILSLRITNAQLLLETTNYSISEISAIVGYDNPLYFSRIFHKQHGISPRQYRNNILAEQEGI
ncbi:MAG: helix-turn-helix transcriptional regulator [Lachnospiraceae bacterium]|nr:helix-turn-helix transcriptional regulator [Lachnospiraceae bacterium]